MIFLIAVPACSLMFLACYLIHGKLGKHYSHPYSLANFISELPEEKHRIVTVDKSGLHVSEPIDEDEEEIEEDIEELEEEIDEVNEETEEINTEIQELEEEIAQEKGEGDQTRSELSKTKLDIDKEKEILKGYTSKVKELQTKLTSKLEAEDLHIAQEHMKKIEELAQMAKTATETAAQLLVTAQIETQQSQLMERNVETLCEDVNNMSRLRDLKTGTVSATAKKGRFRELVDKFKGSPKNASRKKSSSNLSEMEPISPPRSPGPGLELQLS